jgi:gamma-glutamylputrescine oxidase
VGDSRFVINYFRMTPDRRLLFGGGENYRAGFPRDIAAFVRPYLLKIYPQTHSCQHRLRMGRYACNHAEPDAPFRTLERTRALRARLLGQGVGLAHLAGQLIAEMLHGDSTRFDAFAAIPTRAFPGGRWLRWPGMVAGMLYFALRDRL